MKQSPNLRDPNVEAKQGKPTPTKLAQDFFDTHYKQTYGSEWHSIRLALFSKPKFAAVVNNLSVKDEIIHDLKTLGCLSLKELYNEGKLVTFGKHYVYFQFQSTNKSSWSNKVDILEHFSDKICSKI